MTQKIPTELAAIYRLGMDRWGNASTLQFTDFEWVPEHELGSLPYWPDYHSGLTAFGFSARRDEWSLFAEWTSPDEPLVIFCGIAGEGYVYGRNFRDFLIRKVIEEFSVSWLLDERDTGMTTDQRLAKLDEMLRTYPQRLEPILGAEASASLVRLLVGKTLAVQPDTGCPGYLSKDEERDAIENRVGFDWLNRVVYHDRNHKSRYDGMAKPS